MEEAAFHILDVMVLHRNFSYITLQHSINICSSKCWQSGETNTHPVLVFRVQMVVTYLRGNLTVSSQNSRSLCHKHSGHIHANIHGKDVIITILVTEKD
jgi:hypothetical protein